MHIRSLLFVAWLVAAVSGSAAVIDADPSNYRVLLRNVTPGDTLKLARGKYPRLVITGLNGTPDAWIKITGPVSGPPAMIAGAPNYNTVEILNSSYVAIENLRIDSQGIPGVFGISARGRENNLTHHIRIEKNVLVGQNGSQQTDGISTKTPTWGWVIRSNQILGAGTGIYLGDSDGNQPFVGGIIENNLIKDTIGYNLEIKDQNFLPSLPGMPLGPTSTIIRNNVFIKNDQASPDGDRPNLLVGGFPNTGPGSLNTYEIYGNYLLHNHREALFQGSGRISLHDNVFVDGPYTYPAVVLRNQIFPLKTAYVYNNTIYTPERGIYFGSRPMIDSVVSGNLVFALTPISGMVMRQSDNLVDSIENAPLYVKSPSFDSASMDFYPLAGRCQGAAIDLRSVQTDADYSLDFNGTPKTETKGIVAFRGAYAGERANPGWQLQAGLKTPPASAALGARITWIAPAKAPAGSNTTVVFTGANFGPNAALEATGEGIAAMAVKVNSTTQITATFAIAASAAAGIREVTVNTAAGVSNSAKFQITGRSQTGILRKKD